MIPLAHAAGTLYINPPSQPVAPAGTSVTYQVKVANIDPFNGWDIMVQTDPTAINPSSLTITPNLLAANFSAFAIELVHCVNGVGTGCTLGDGPGIVHSAVVALTPPPQTGPSSGLLFTITYTAGSGTYSPVHIFSDTFSNGTSTPVAHITQDGIYGTPQLDFLIGADQNFLNIPQGSLAASTISLTSLNGFAGTLSLTATVSPTIPNGPTASFDKPNLVLPAGGTNSSMLTLSAIVTTPIGNYNITVAGSSGSLTHSLLIFVRVQGFSLTPSPTTQVLLRGTSGISTINLTSVNGFTGNVTLTATVSPVMANSPIASVRPASLALKGDSGTFFLNVTTTTDTPMRSYTVTVNGTSGSLSHTATVTVIVTDFTISVNPTSISFPSGSTADVTITAAALNGFTGVVSLTVTGAPPGCTATLSPTSVTLGTSGTSILTVNCSTTATFTTNVTGTSGTVSRSATAAVTVTDYTVTASPTAIMFNAGSSATSTITVAPVNGFTGTVTLAATGAPAGCTATLSATSIVLGASQTSTLTVSCSSAVAGFTVTVTGTSPGALSHSATVSVTVTDYTVTASPTAISFNAGSSATSTITVAPVNGFTGTVTLAATGAPAGCYASLNPTTVTLGTSVTSTLTVSCSSVATFSLTVTAISGFLARMVTIPVTVKPSIVVTNISVSPTGPVTIGQRVTVTVTILNNGTSTQDFTVQILWGDLIVAQQTGTLSPGQEKPFTFYWDTSGRAPDTRPITAALSSGSSMSGPSVALTTPAQPFLTSSQILLVAGGGAATAITILSLFVFLRRRKTPTM